MKKILLLLLCFQNLAFSQNKKGQNEISLPLHPWIAITGSFYGDFEHFHSPVRSTIFRVGYQGESFLVSYFSNLHLKGARVDIGQRWYLKGETAKAFRFFGGVNATFENTKLRINDNGYNFPKDSIQTTGISFAPEINSGLKIVVLKKFTITTSIALRHYFNTMKPNKLTNNPNYWAYDDWNNTKPTWQENRKAVELNNFRKGFLLIPYLQFGWVF